jgi:hypothetical protein
MLYVLNLVEDSFSRLATDKLRFETRILLFFLSTAGQKMRGLLSEMPVTDDWLKFLLVCHLDDSQRKHHKLDSDRIDKLIRNSCRKSEWNLLATH